MALTPPSTPIALRPNGSLSQGTVCALWYFQCHECGHIDDCRHDKSVQSSVCLSEKGFSLLEIQTLRHCLQRRSGALQKGSRVSAAYSNQFLHSPKFQTTDITTAWKCQLFILMHKHSRNKWKWEAFLITASSHWMSDSHHHLCGYSEWRSVH